MEHSSQQGRGAQKSSGLCVARGSAVPGSLGGRPVTHLCLAFNPDLVKQIRARGSRGELLRLGMTRADAGVCCRGVLLCESHGRSLGHLGLAVFFRLSSLQETKPESVQCTAQTGTGIATDMRHALPRSPPAPRFRLLFSWAPL